MIVLPSVWEGLPLTLFEALASGRPLLASKIPVFKDISKDEVLFFNSSDSAGLSKKILFLINNRKKADKLGKKGEILAKGYDWGKIAKDYENLIFSIDC